VSNPRKRDRVHKLIPKACKQATALVALGIALCCAASPAAAVAAPEARVSGTFSMHARVTTAVNVVGEHRGEILSRRWVIVPAGCTLDVCASLQLERQHNGNLYSAITLSRRGPGSYAGKGVFYAALECRGRLYQHGSRVPYRITLRVTATQEIEGIVFAKRIAATYVNSRRADSTPCPLGPSHDAGVYTGALTAAPAAPTAAFTTAVDAATATVAFTDASQAGGGNGAIVSQTWSFGDPESPSGNSSTLQDPTHTYLVPGSYAVTLVVFDAEGLSASVTETVTVGPASEPPPGSAPSG
jgi:hypothetical protein